MNDSSKFRTRPTERGRRTGMPATRFAMRLVWAAALMLSLSEFAGAQAYRVRPLARPAPRYVASGGTLTVSATPSIVSFALAPQHVSQGSSGVTITTSWDVFGILPQLTLYGYFASSSSALSDGRTPAHLIPSSAVLGQVPTGVPTSYTAFTQTTPFGGAGLNLVNDTLGIITTTGSRTDTLNLQIDLSGTPNLPAGVYTGTLTIQASMN